MKFIQIKFNMNRFVYSEIDRLWHNDPIEEVNRHIYRTIDTQMRPVGRTIRRVVLDECYANHSW